jgi:hypothetical protein
MRRTLVLVAAIAVLGVVSAQLPRHPHMLVHAPQFDIIEGQLAVVGWRKCVDLAGGRSVPLQAHHSHIHTGTAGRVLAENADIHVVPGAPLTPWANCAALAAALPIIVGPVD